MSCLQIRIKGWRDGEQYDMALEKVDRWALHTADEVLVNIFGLSVVLLQKPNALTGSRLGVGACVWEGALVLAGYLASQAQHRYIGSRCVELGAGVGLVGLALAKMGAKVVLTDRGVLVPLMEQNAAANSLDHRKRGPGQGSVEVMELDWGTVSGDQAVERLASERVDFVLAADCCYEDNDGVSPSMPAFVQVCSGLCGPSTTVLLAFETRSRGVKAVMMEELHKAFTKIERVPPAKLPEDLQLEHIELFKLQR